ncbi:CoA-acylating methylmalonate-semialdehyde dehydrogenase [Nocardia nova]|uniref:CoA-acylating methylmalonate-semialdehyde dehydrogenase n=1 Tax=Nocardia nova TaxID=37330 RepID=UPI0018950B5D|nr:CoA-acylating methylmalonate-semialdehyde dehydrogenase [Nocardia nova]MBF6148389.1 CoA-acylating methylmalonate-semialdehyde dehydrogenase [Nocardia nova]MDN2496288.1 CoA-acylating methylmalonate-semialdehyde dehydrogenase [Nocardia nova]
MTTIPHWIDGRPHVSAGDQLHVLDPATGQTLASVALADDDTVKQVVASSAAALPAWRDLPASRRAQVLYAFRDLIRKNQDELAELITAQHGKTLDDARGEVARGLDSVELACGVPGLLKGEVSEQTGRGIDTFSTLHPLGVVLGITPFNFPVMIPLMMAAVAIAAGNTFILKPSEQDPGPALRLAELAKEAGLPDGVLSVIHGQQHVVEALIDHPEVAGVSFVGSTPIAHSVYKRAANAGKRVQAFGGAKNHLVVMPDAPIEAAADAISSAGFGAAGQRCMAISVAVAVGGVGDDLVAALSERAKAVVVGPGNDPKSEIGPVVSAAAQQRIQGIVAAAKQAGANVIVDRSTEIVPGFENGFYVGPTLVDRVDPTAEIYRAEVFGPVVVVVRVDTLDDALKLIHDHEYGNGASIFTTSGGAARKFQREASAGMVGVNVPIPVPVAPYAVAGWKNSVFGDTGLNNAAWRFYTQPKYVTSRWDETVTGVDFGFRPN